MEKRKEGKKDVRGFGDAGHDRSCRHWWNTNDETEA